HSNPNAEQVHQLDRGWPAHHVAMVAQEGGRLPGYRRRGTGALMGGAIENLREWMGQLADLRSAAQLLEWDQQTMMPARGAATRAEALATLHGVSHGKFVSARTGSLLDAAQAALDGLSPDSDEASLVRVTKRR